MTDAGSGRWACESAHPWEDYVLSLPHEAGAAPAFAIDEMARSRTGVAAALRLRAARTVGYVLDRLEAGSVDVDGVIYSGELRLVGYSSTREVHGSEDYVHLRVELAVV